MPAATTRALFMFHGAAELRRVRKPPHPGARVRRAPMEDWIVGEVFRSGADTYTVICVAPGEITRLHTRVAAYIRRDREFVLLTALISASTVVALSGVTSVWAAFAVVATVDAFACFAWATK